MADRVIAVEEHFVSESVNRAYKEIALKGVNDPARLAKAAFIDAFVSEGKITEVGERRLKRMEQSGVDVQMISYGNNSPMELDKEYAVPLCRQANDELAAWCRQFPGRFYGFAVLPVADIEASAAELERCVKELGFKGAVFNGNFRGGFLDGERYFPIFEKAAQLHVPIQFHPGEVDGAVQAHYYQGSWPLAAANLLAGHAMGWHYDSGVQYVRMVLSGIFDRLPGLTLICGHWGEMIPYYFNRLDKALPPEVTGLGHEISYYFKNNMYLTPSGMFFEDDLTFCLEKMGAGRILWAADDPYCTGENSRDFIRSLKLSDEDKERIAYRNAQELFGIDLSSMGA